MADAGEKMLTLEWRCYFCSDVFTSAESAAEHFGSDEGCYSEGPACKLNEQDGGILRLYREALGELRKYQIEDNAMARTFYALGADHCTALVREEEKGYARGLRDGMAESSATIKRLETPVADWDVEEAAAELGRDAAALRATDREKWAGELENAASLLRRQAREIERLKAGLAAEQSGAETLDSDGMDANDKLGTLANLILDLRTATPYAEKVKAYARFCLSQGPNPLLEILRHEQEGSISAALSLNSVETREMKP